MMVAWYGGSAFDQGRINADAARLLTEGSQIERAVGLYRAQEGRTPDVADSADPLKPLITRRYLADAPSGDIGRWFVDYTSNMIRADVGAADDSRALMVCHAARKSQRLPNPNMIYRCDGSDYPLSHPLGSLPANEPCCVYTGATSADITGGRGSTNTGGATTGGNGGTTDPNYNPVGSTNSFSCGDRVDFLRRSFDAIQTGTKAFYLKYHQITTIEQLVDMGFVPAWAMTAKSGDYTNPSVATAWGHSPWPDINSGKPYVHVNLTDDVFSCFAANWNTRYGAQSTVDNYYGNHLSERISLPLFPTDVSTITAALDESAAAIDKYRTDKGFIPRSINALIGDGYLSGLPTSGYGVTSGEFVLTARSQAEHDSQGDSRAIGIVLNSEEACRAFNVKSYGVDEVPAWATRDRGCARLGGQVVAYSYVTGDLDPSTWYPYDEMAMGNPSPHFVFTTSKPDLITKFDGARIGMSGYAYWSILRSGNRFAMHPGPATPDTTTLRFVAPSSGTYRLRGAWQPGGTCGNANGVSVAVTGLGSRYSDASQPWVFDFQRSLSPGGTVDFTVGNRGDDACDTTILDLVVTKN